MKNLYLALMVLSITAHAQNPGSLDLDFATGMGADGRLHTTAIQPDGKIIIGGNFTSYDGTAINRIARLNSDGTLDGSFTVGNGASTVGTGPGSVVRTIAIQPDGKIIIGGQFNSFDGITINCIARLNADGTLDESFTVGTGANGEVLSTALQPDGKIIIGGEFNSYNGTAINRIARLNADGTMDDSFTVGTGADNRVQTTVRQPDGKIIIGGWFNTYNGIPQKHLTRLNADGTRDDSFTVGTGANNMVQTIAIQPDGKIIIGGDFFSYDGTASNHIARLNTEGTLDDSFNVGIGTNTVVHTIAIQPDGKVVIGGWFNSYNGIPKNNLTRLNSDGSLDGSFAIGTGADGYILTTAIHPNGGIMIGGNFTSYAGTARYRIARLHGIEGVGMCNIAPSEFSMFPNPTSGLFTLAPGEVSGTIHLTVTDITGCVVHTKQFIATCSTTHTIDLESHANGIYTLQLQTAQGTVTQKLVKN